MAKKKQGKKFRSQAQAPLAASTATAGQVVAERSTTPTPAKGRPINMQPRGVQAASSVVPQNFNHITRDLRWILSLGVGLLLLEVLLWYLFENTGLGAAVYGLIKL